MPVERLRWIAFAHLEADECGAVDEFLEVAPHAQVAHGALGVMLSLQDQLPRPPRPLDDGEVLDLGGAWTFNSSSAERAVLELDTVEFCRVLSCRGTGTGMLATRVPF